MSFLCVAALSCSDGAGSTEVAKTAYLGLDASIDRAITLGFQGFNNALGANIAPQTASGDAAGTMTITGQVDQGTSTNSKTMRLQEALVAYSDDGTVTYATAMVLPELDMDLKNVPTGTLTGTLTGDYEMTGALSGTVSLAITFSSQLEPGATPNQVTRIPGTTRVVGTAATGGGTYSIDITR